MPVYQLFYRPDQRDRLFDHAPYVPFGLEPCVNPDIAANCPELETEVNRTLLVEYGAMLHIWRNADRWLDTDWIGFTSYRQRDKTAFTLCGSDIPLIDNLLEEYDILGWLFYNLRRPVFAQGEFWHRGMGAFIETLFRAFDRKIPQRFRTDRSALFANYWIMRSADFNAFMEWSFPMIQWCLQRQNKLPFIASSAKSIGYVMERLFIAWYLTFDKSLCDLPHTLGRQP